MKINDPELYSPKNYQLLPFRFERIGPNSCLLVNEVGEHCYLNNHELEMLVNGSLEPSCMAFQKLYSKSFVYTEENNYSLRTFCSKYKARKSFIFDGPALHIFVLTLRCENSCDYCQVTRRNPDAKKYDMPLHVARQSVYRMFECPAKNLTVEFQGGEPLLAFDVMKFIIELSVEQNTHHNKNLQFVVATSLQNINEEMLEFFHQHDVHISTSVDGPEWLHKKNRPSCHSNSYESTLKGLEQARKILGHDKIAGMTTITKSSLSSSKAIIVVA